MDIKYEITFFSEWHCGSGLSAGADTDALVIKDSAGLPYIPGKTIKGLFREAVEDLISLNQAKMQSDVFYSMFGYFKDKECLQKGSLFFSDAELPGLQRQKIIEAKVQRFLYRRTSSTAIDKDGIVVPHSLRSMETTVPCKLKGCIKNIPEGVYDDIESAAKLIKRLGQNRNRGLGRCDISIIEPKEKEEK